MQPNSYTVGTGVCFILIVYLLAVNHPLITERIIHCFGQYLQIVQSPSGSSSSGDYPMFILRDGRCHDWNGQHTANSDKPERYLRVRHVDQNGQLISPVRETEDFVFLDT